MSVPMSPPRARATVIPRGALIAVRQSAGNRRAVAALPHEVRLAADTRSRQVPLVAAGTGAADLIGDVCGSAV